MRKLLPASLGALVAAVVAIEVVWWWAGRSPSRSAGSCAVLVLGTATHDDGSPHFAQRFRVETGVAVHREQSCERMIFSGGPVANEWVEAETMAALAEELGVDRTEMILEPSARSTWENVGCSARHTLDLDRVLVVSNALHARRAVRYACRQDPERCAKYRPAGAAPPLEAVWWRWGSVAYSLAAFGRDLLFYELGPLEDAPRCVSGV